MERIYKKSKTGAVVYCEISVNGAEITVETGQVGTDKPTFHKTTCEPKNTGRANATIAEEQAVIEAIAKHTKKMKERYVLSPTGESEIILAMKVKGYQDQKKNVIFPCFMSPKLDGGNGLHKDNDLFTRGGEPFPTFDKMGETGYFDFDKNFVVTGYSMDQEIQLVKEALDVDVLNGELYIHGEHLQDIQSATKKFNDMTGKLEFHVFDYCGTDHKFTERMRNMSMVSDQHYVKLVESVIANSHEEIEKYHAECVEDGYEGIIIRNADGLYEYNVRSSDVFKYKIPKDAEFEVIGHNIDKHGHAVWVCVCNISSEKYFETLATMIPKDAKILTKQHTFSVKRKGTAPVRLEEAAIADSKVGQWLKIEFESYSKDMKPQKPVGTVWRECDSEGNPLE